VCYKIVKYVWCYTVTLHTGIATGILFTIFTICTNKLGSYKIYINENCYELNFRETYCKFVALMWAKRPKGHLVHSPSFFGCNKFWSLWLADVVTEFAVQVYTTAQSQKWKYICEMRTGSGIFTSAEKESDAALHITTSQVTKDSIEPSKNTWLI
jgi:hypothetical protein